MHTAEVQDSGCTQNQGVQMLERKDIQILSYLRNNARTSLTKMSRATHIPVSTIYDRLKLHEQGVILKHTALLDFGKLGFNARANIFLKVDKNSRDSVKEYLLKNQHVNSVYRINNGWDFMVEAIFKNINDVEDFFESIENKHHILEKQYFYVIEEIEREAFLSKRELMNIVI